MERLLRWEGQIREAVRGDKTLFLQILAPTNIVAKMLQNSHYSHLEFRRGRYKSFSLTPRPLWSTFSISVIICSSKISTLSNLMSLIYVLYFSNLDITHFSTFLSELVLSAYLIYLYQMLSSFSNFQNRVASEHIYIWLCLMTKGAVELS